VRENRTHGSEGGEGKTLPDPYQIPNLDFLKSYDFKKARFVVKERLSAQSKKHRSMGYDYIITESGATSSFVI